MTVYGVPLPPGWTTVTLAELAADEPNAITDGPFGSNLKTAHYTDAGPRVIRLQNIGDGVFVEAKAHISEEHFSRLAKHRIESGDLVVAALGETLPRACVIPSSVGPAIVKADCVRFKPHAGLTSSRYLNFALNSEIVRRRTASIVHGVGRPRLNLGEIKSIEVPLAPLQEQGLIVEAIEEQFTRLDAAVAGLKQVQQRLKRYRASVLKAACEGRLVSTEAELARTKGREYEPAARLLERILVERQARGGTKKEPSTPIPATLPELPDGWEWSMLRLIADIKGGLTKGQKRKSTDVLRDVPYLRVANVQRGFLDLRDMRTIEATESEIEGLRLEPGDILFNEGGDRDKLGRGWIWRGELGECIHQNHVFRARLCLPNIAPQFISWYGNTKGQQYFIDEGKQTTNLASINLTKLGALPIPIPPQAEQERIVAEVERRLSVVEKAETAVEANLKRAERMRQAILKRAFEGKLVPQDPNDEPAGVLLERIRAEREGAVRTAPKRRGRRPADDRNGGTDPNGQLRLLDGDDVIAAKQRVVRRDR